jgi:hypothetical protein
MIDTKPNFQQPVEPLAYAQFVIAGGLACENRNISPPSNLHRDVAGKRRSKCLITSSFSVKSGG